MPAPTDRGRSPQIARRAVLSGIAGAGAALCLPSLWSTSGGALVPVGGPGVTRPRGPEATPPSLLNVMAHPDDDLYFTNPDTLRLAEAGVPVVSVYVTAGEALGRNWVAGMPEPVVRDRAAYSSARHQGLRQAYAEMVGAHRFTPWERSVMGLPGGVRAETNQLVVGDRRVRLIFLNIAMHSPGDVRLPHLWARPDAVMQTLVATGSPCTTVSTYRHRTLVTVLLALMRRFEPTVVHTLDPDPDFQVHDAAHPKDNDYGGCSDHRDHTPTALFTWKALAQWAAGAARQRADRPPYVHAIAFRGYYNQRWPHNLPPRVVAEKHRLVAAYGGDPSWQCGNAAGCGDYGQGGDRPLRNRKGWIRSTHHRYPGAGPVAAVDRAGRLEAYGVLGTRAVRWRETSPGSGRWGEPLPLGGGPLAPALATVVDSAGRRLLFALRFAVLEGRGRPDRREIAVLEQRSPGGPFEAWAGLGGPERTAALGRRVGVPVAVPTPDGRVHLFVRTAAKGLACRVREPGGAWGAWRDLGGEEIQDGLTVVLDRRRRVHVFGAGRDTVHHWSQDAPGGPVRFRPLTGLPGPGGGPVGAACGPDGDLTLVYRLPAAEEPLAFRLAAGDRAEPVDAPGLRGFAGYGDLTAFALPRPGGRSALVVVGRGMDGELRLADVFGGTAPRRSAAQRSPVGTASLVVDAMHRLCAVGWGPDATPWIWRPDDGGAPAP
ncbi:PIG-L family deacetylase [Streptomyces sp. URMC 123]|uniref:PIG-L family deacetylase n=1 Tax=Streptomyces sp. URMC 123 TaxID=3423403 RepID=UPI003F1E1173